MAVDPPDDRLAEVAQGEEEVGDPAPIVVPVELARAGIEGRAEVGAGAEGAVAGAGQDDDPHGGLGTAPGEGGREVADHRGRERVSLLGLVEGHRRHRAVESDQHRFEAGSSHVGIY